MTHLMVDGPGLVAVRRRSLAFGAAFKHGRGSPGGSERAGSSAVAGCSAPNVSGQSLIRGAGGPVVG